MSTNAVLDDLMAPDWKYLLENLHPQLEEKLQSTTGYDEGAWQALLAQYPTQLALTPQLINELDSRLRETLQTETILDPTDVVDLAREAELAQQEDVVIADGSALGVPEVLSATVVLLYFINVAAVIINNRLRSETEKKQDIPTPANILKHINFTEVVRNIPVPGKIPGEQLDKGDSSEATNLPDKSSS